MDNSEDNIKDLTVNGRLLARYDIRGDTVFIKVAPPYIMHGHLAKSEEFCILLIGLIENKSLRQAGYLNVEIPNK